VIEYIHVEPAHEQRPGFAAWGLAQTPPLQTASATGWDVPVDLYAVLPPELLEGGYVDGFPYDVAQAQPLVSATTAPAAEAPARTGPARKARKRPAKKATSGAYTRKPSDVEQVVLLAEATSGGPSDE